MTWRINIRGATTQSALAEYLCPEHGVFEATVERPPPDDRPCPECGATSPWTITSAPLGKVRAVEVVRGKWEKPEKKTYLDTRELGEGMELDEWREKRKAIRDEQRWRETKELLK